MRLRQTVARMTSLFRGRRRADELSEEIAQHLELLTREHRQRGLSPTDARDAALRSFGGVDRIRSLHREQSSFPTLDGLAQDLRFALRMLRHPGFALPAILVLGLGIGINNMMFTLIYSATMRGLPIAEPDRVLFISSFDQHLPDRALSYPEFDDLRRHAGSFESLAAFTDTPLVVSEERRAPDRFEGTYVSANAFALVGTTPILGRVFTEHDDRQGAAPVVILGNGAWRARYDSDPAILGRSIVIDGSPATVIGVMPEPSRFPTMAEVWLPLVRLPSLDAENRAARQLRVIGRLKPGVTTESARAEVEALTARIAQQHPDTSTGLQARVVPINRRFFGDPTQATWLAFSTAAILVLLVTCANAGTVMLASAGTRTRELAIRGSLGATRLRVVCQLLVESVAIAAAAGAVGLAVSLIAVRIFNSAVPSGSMPYWQNFEMDGGVLIALVITSFATVLLFGLVPAIHASRTDINHVLKDGGRGGTARSRLRYLTTAFLVVEFALTVVILTPFIESYRGDNTLPPSDEIVATTAVTSAMITLPAAKYGTAQGRLDFFDQLGERLRGTAMVSGFALANALPHGGSAERRFEIEGRSVPDPAKAHAARVVVVSRGYFDTLTLPVVKGRDFVPQDGLLGQQSAIINESLAALHFGDSDPIGKRIQLFTPDAPSATASWLTIAGVAPDIRQRTTTGAEPLIYLPYRAQPASTMSVLVRSQHDPEDVAAMLRQEVMALDPYLPLYRVMTLAAFVDQANWNGRVSHRLITTLTFIALCVSVIGLYAATSHTVTERTHEIGIRMALGAAAADVRRLVVRRATVQVGLGFLVGLAGSAIWNSFFAFERTDQLVQPAVAGMVATGLAAITLLACFVPSRRATRLDPVAALREQ